MNMHSLSNLSTIGPILFWAVLGLCAPMWSCGQSPCPTDPESLLRDRNQYREQLLRMEGMDTVAVNFFPPDPAFCIWARFTPADDAQPFYMASIQGERERFVKFGELEFELGGTKGRLSLYRNLDRLRLPGGREKVLLPFRDPTNGESTYGGGRYLDLNLSDIREGRVHIDFNRAYFPLCAHGGKVPCPLPPAENHLAFPVEAGEKLP